LNNHFPDSKKKKSSRKKSTPPDPDSPSAPPSPASPLTDEEIVTVDLEADTVDLPAKTPAGVPMEVDGDEPLPFQGIVHLPSSGVLGQTTRLRQWSWVFQTEDSRIYWEFLSLGMKNSKRLFLSQFRNLEDARQAIKPYEVPMTSPSTSNNGKLEFYTSPLRCMYIESLTCRSKQRFINDASSFVAYDFIVVGKYFK
jgi:hypothetical protein